MSQELERIYTINLGKVLLSPDNRRAKRAINMIKEFAKHHMKIENIRIDEELSQKIWERGIRRPPRKIKVIMTKTDQGFVVVSLYDDAVEKIVQLLDEQQQDKVTDSGEIKKLDSEKKEDDVETTIEKKEDDVETTIEKKEDDVETTKERK